jgi:hypothetical protein
MLYLCLAGVALVFLFFKVLMGASQEADDYEAKLEKTFEATRQKTPFK